MLRSIIVLLSCGVGYFVYAHPHCHYDQREVDVGRDLTFCSMEYAPEGICCTEEEETALEATFNAAGALTAECADYYKQVLCHRQNFLSVYCNYMQDIGLDGIYHLAPSTIFPGSAVNQCFGPLFTLNVRYVRF